MNERLHKKINQNVNLSLFVINQRQSSTDLAENLQQSLFSGQYNEESFENSFKNPKVIS